MKYGFDIEWEKVAPTKAMKYLETMGDSNRNVRQTHIDYLASQMRAGLWRRNPQPIMFDKNGRLVDGQHRLWACVESEIEIDLLVARGVSPEDVPAIDSGLARDYKDVAHYEGWNVDPMTAAIAKILVRGPGMAHAKVPPEVAHRWYEFYKEAIDFALSLRNQTRPSAGKSITAPMTAAIARAYSSVGAERLTRFAEILKTGQVSVEADRAAFVLRDAWLANRLGASKVEQYLKTEGAIRAFVERRAVRTLQKPAAELFKIKALPQAIRYEATSSLHSPRTSAAARKEAIATTKAREVIAR